MRFAVDTGGTFTDLVVEEDDGAFTVYKAHTTVADPLDGLMDALQLAAVDRGQDLAALLARGSMFIHGTTRSINAVVTGTTARTAFLTTEGHPDILLFREGGRPSPFDFSLPYPQPYVPRRLTFEIPERVDAAGSVVRPLDEAVVMEVIERLRTNEVEAVAVCLLWSILNPSHERRIGELLDEHLEGVPYTLSHQLNPIVREYRRASSTCIDASLKPVMSTYLERLERRLRDAGFDGRVLVVTSGGGVLDASDVAAAPIHTLNSGPSMAPVAGRYFARQVSDSDDAIVADTGGTTYDISLIRDGHIPRTQETWLGPRLLGHMTGFPSVDVRSVGAGGGSIAWVDEGGLLHVGPRSAGSQPGPVCYGRGGTEPTVTDASLLLGYIDPDYFLGGSMQLDVPAARAAMESLVAVPLGLDVTGAAAATMQLATEAMVRAIEDITINQGIDPAGATLIGGGGAAGLNSVAIARRLGSRTVVIPRVGAALSAAGALMSELMAEYSCTSVTSSEDFDFANVEQALARLRSSAHEFLRGPGADGIDTRLELTVEARYPHQIWELEVPVRGVRLDSEDAVRHLVDDFHAAHERVFAIQDVDAHVEFVTWRMRVHSALRAATSMNAVDGSGAEGHDTTRRAWFPQTGWVDAPVVPFGRVPAESDEAEALKGPALVESPHTTVVVDAGAQTTRLGDGSLCIRV